MSSKIRFKQFIKFNKSLIRLSAFTAAFLSLSVGFSLSSWALTDAQYLQLLQTQASKKAADSGVSTSAGTSNEHDANLSRLTSTYINVMKEYNSLESTLNSKKSALQHYKHTKEFERGPDGKGLNRTFMQGRSRTQKNLDKTIAVLEKEISNMTDKSGSDWRRTYARKIDLEVQIKIALGQIREETKKDPAALSQRLNTILSEVGTDSSSTPPVPGLPPSVSHSVAPTSPGLVAQPDSGNGANSHRANPHHSSQLARLHAALPDGGRPVKTGQNDSPSPVVGSDQAGDDSEDEHEDIDESQKKLFDEVGKILQTEHAGLLERQAALAAIALLHKGSKISDEGVHDPEPAFDMATHFGELARDLSAARKNNDVTEIKKIEATLIKRLGILDASKGIADALPLPYSVVSKFTPEILNRVWFDTESNKLVLDEESDEESDEHQSSPSPAHGSAMSAHGSKTVRFSPHGHPRETSVDVSTFTRVIPPSVEVKKATVQNLDEIIAKKKSEVEAHQRALNEAETDLNKRRHSIDTVQKRLIKLKADADELFGQIMENPGDQKKIMERLGAMQAQIQANKVLVQQLTSKLNSGSQTPEEISLKLKNVSQELAGLREKRVLVNYPDSSDADWNRWKSAKRTQTKEELTVELLDLRAKLGNSREVLENHPDYKVDKKSYSEAKKSVEAKEKELANLESEMERQKAQVMGLAILRSKTPSQEAEFAQLGELWTKNRENSDALRKELPGLRKQLENAKRGRSEAHQALVEEQNNPDGPLLSEADAEKLIARVAFLQALLESSEASVRSAPPSIVSGDPRVALDIVQLVNTLLPHMLNGAAPLDGHNAQMIASVIVKALIEHGVIPAQQHSRPGAELGF